MKNRFCNISEFVADTSLKVLMRNKHWVDRSIIQYANRNHVRGLFLHSNELLNTINPDKSYLNIGTGIGHLEYINNKYYQLDLKTCDLSLSIVEPLFKTIQNKSMSG